MGFHDGPRKQREELAVAGVAPRRDPDARELEQPREISLDVAVVARVEELRELVHADHEYELMDVRDGTT